MEAPIMIFIFLCFVVLMIMFYLMLRSMDELIVLLKEERNAMSEQFRSMSRNMENLAMTQREARDILRAMLGPEADPTRQPEQRQEPAQQEEPAPENESGRNITNFILAE